MHSFESILRTVSFSLGLSTVRMALSGEGPAGIPEPVPTLPRDLDPDEDRDNGDDEDDGDE